jgi:hypothetical protein
MKHTRNAEYIHKKNKKLTTQMGMEGKTHPITQTTAPMRDKTKAIRAKGNPIKKPKGLQSSIIYNLLFSLSFFFFFFFRLVLSFFPQVSTTQDKSLFANKDIFGVWREKGIQRRKVNYNHYLPKQVLIL